MSATRSEPVSAERAVRWLAALLVLTAVLCVGLAYAWRREHLRAQCWRAMVEEDQAQPEGDCGR